MQKGDQFYIIYKKKSGKNFNVGYKSRVLRLIFFTKDSLTYLFDIFFKYYIN
jgi:hypothetical protein